MNALWPWRLALWTALLLAAPALLAASEPRLVLSKRFPGSRPEFVELRIMRDGQVEYREVVDEEPLRLRLTAAETQAVFDLAEKLDHFRRPLESGLKVARMGEKLFRWEDGDQHSETRFNFTTDLDGQALQDWYERIVESEQLVIDLARTVKYDHLGVNQTLLELEAAYDNKRLVALGQYLPLLDRVAKNEAYMNMARERAARLADTFRAPPAPKAAP
ncbi:MAG: hypothetical protein ACLQBJ_20065 [Bryobacteraceae bacterium]